MAGRARCRVPVADDGVQEEAGVRCEPRRGRRHASLAERLVDYLVHQDRREYAAVGDADRVL
jgi:hypothetical protein